MKTLDATIWQDQGVEPVISKKPMPFKAAPLRRVMAFAWALLAATATITLSVWAAGLEANAMLGVGTWGMGFIFLGLAVDSRGALARLEALSGITLAVLALLQNSVSPGFIIVSGVLLAAWLAAVVLRYLSCQVVK